jgi:WD40 repeat protein
VLERTLGGEKAHGLFADRVNAVRFSPDGRTLATGGGEPSRSGDIILFDVASGKATHTWKDRHTDAVLGLDFSPDGRLLASGAADKLAKVIDIATGKQVNLFEGHTHHVMGVAFRADGRVLATAGADGVVLAWNMITGERKKKIEGWTKEVTSVQFVGATNQIVTSAGDNRIRIVTDDGAEIRSIASLPDYMQASVSTPDGATIVGGGEDSFLRVWDGTGKELAAFGGK